MDMDFATSCPLVRPCLPRIRLLFVGSRFRSTLPSDGPSQFRPCASLVLHLHQVAQGTFTPRLPDMPGTQGSCGIFSPVARRKNHPRRRPRAALLTLCDKFLLNRLPIVENDENEYHVLQKRRELSKAPHFLRDMMRVCF